MSNLASRGADPLTTFNFEVVIGGVSIPFTKVSSIEMTIETETLTEGGEGRFTHALLKAPSAEKVLQLERGVAPQAVASDLLRVGMMFDMMLIYVHDKQRRPMRIYMVHQAQLKKQSFSDLDASSGKVFVERLEFIYREMIDTSN